MSTTTPPPEGTVRWAGLVRALDAIRGVIDTILAGLCLILFVGLVVIVTWQVFTRQILNNSAPWTTEAAQYSFVVLAIFAAAYVFSERGHIAVEMLLERLPLVGQKGLSVVIDLIVSFFIGTVFILGGSLVTVNAWNQQISTLPLTVGQVYTVMPVAGAIILFYSLTHAVEVLAGAVSPVSTDEVGEAI